MMKEIDNTVNEFIKVIDNMIATINKKKNNETLKAGAAMYYWDHGVLRKRIVHDVRMIDTTELEYNDKCSLRSLLKRSNLPRFVYDVKFCYSDKHILMVQASNKGQWSTGTMYYWDNLDDWAFHQELRELKMNEKIDRALAEIAYARKQLNSISKKFRKLRKTVLL